MLRCRMNSLLLVTGLSGALLAGCNGGDEFKTHDELPAATDDHGHGHDHGKPGPHGGSLVELGAEEYHAELVVDHDAHAVRVYILDKEGKTAVPTAAPELKMSVGKDETLTLKPVKQESDPEGQASVFELVDDGIVHDLLDAGFVHGRLSVTIGDTPYSGNVDVHFDDDHDHDHAEEKKPAETPAQP